MKRHRFNIFSIIVIAFAFTIGCESDLPQIAWEGEKVRFATTEDHLPCGRALEILNDDVVQVEQDLALSLAGGAKVTYYWLPDHMHLSPCPSWVSGCASDYTIFTTKSSHRHEVVHILTSELGPGHAFLSEGFAEAFNGYSRFELRNEDNLAARIKRCLISYAVSADIDYPLAGKFIRFLITEYGLDQVKSVYARVSPGSDEEDYDQIFRATLGASLDSIIKQFVQKAPECYATPTGCHDMAARDPWIDGVWEHRFTMSCTEGVAEASGGEIFQSTVVDIPTSGPYMLEVAGTFGFKLAVQVVPCGGVNENCDFDNVTAYAGEVRTPGLDAGRYQIIASSPNTESTVIDVRLSAL